MFNIAFIIILSFMPNMINADAIDTIFGIRGLDIEITEIVAIRKLIKEISKLSLNEQANIAILTYQMLNSDFNTLKDQVKAYKIKKTRIPYQFYFDIFVVQQQMDHFKKFSSKYKNSLIFNFLSKQIDKEIAKNLYNYCLFERNILSNYQSLISYLASQHIASLPEIINFWDNQHSKNRLKKSAQQLNASIKIQMTTGIRVIVDVATQTAILAGTSLSTQFIDTQDQELYQELTRQQQKISNEWQQFRATLQKKQTDSLKSIKNIFTKKQGILSKEYQENSLRLNQEIVYLNQSINFSQPTTRFLSQPIEWDRYFESSIMLTPNSEKRLWYNVFGPFNKSNWLYNAQTNSFIQSNHVELPLPFYWQQSEQDKNIFTHDPSNYSIFTEWYTDKNTYDIEIECKVTSLNRPFFIGILFNRARWISGDPERLWWYRSCGIYTKDATSDPKIGFAQQKLIAPTQEKNIEKIVSPLEQIMVLNDKNNLAIKNDITQGILIFTISNNPQSSKITITQKKQDKKITLFSQEYRNLDAYIFRYHGIGFIAAGAQAQFTIRKPNELVFTKEDITSFNNNLSKKT